jgi:ATP-dependent DNA helicase RecG
VPYNDIDLEAMLLDIEADWIERKAAWAGDASEKCRQAVCAFANDLPDRRRDGVLFIGVDDKGKPTHYRITDEVLRSLADMKTDGKIVPPPSLTVEKRLLQGAEVAVVCVRPSDSPPVHYDGRIWIRVGPRRAIATSQDERILNEKRQSLDKPFDARASRALLTDLDIAFLTSTYLPSAVARSVLEENGRTHAEQFASLKLLVSATNEIATNVGVLVAGKSPLDFLVHVPRK